MIEQWLLRTDGTRTSRTDLFALYIERSGDNCTPNAFYRKVRACGFKERKGVTRDFLDVSIRDVAGESLPIRSSRKLVKSGYVYFITDGELVKIGCSKNVNLRLMELQVGNGNALTILKTIFVENRFKVEAAMHDIFANRRVHGEWFDILDLFYT